MNLRYLSMTQLSEVTGVDRRTVKSRLADLKPIKTEARAIIYDAHMALPLVLRTGDKMSVSQIEKQMAEEQLRHEKAKADKISLEVQKMQGEVVNIEDVARTVGKEYSYVRAALLSIPSKRAKALAIEDDPAVIQSSLLEDINEVLSHMQADANLEITPEQEDEIYFPEDESTDSGTPNVKRSSKKTETDSSADTEAES